MYAKQWLPADCLHFSASGLFGCPCCWLSLRLLLLLLRRVIIAHHVGALIESKPCSATHRTDFQGGAEWHFEGH